MCCLFPIKSELTWDNNPIETLLVPLVQAPSAFLNQEPRLKNVFKFMCSFYFLQLYLSMPEIR